jgi:hypothetical protein
MGAESRQRTGYKRTDAVSACADLARFSPRLWLTLAASVALCVTKGPRFPELVTLAGLIAWL